MFQPQNIRLFLLAALFSLLSNLGAQEVITGLPSNPIIAKEAKKLQHSNLKENTPPLRLPFIEDFSSYIGYPDPAKFLDQQAFVNNTYPINPPSVGVVTLDALNQYGEIYAHANSTGFFADTLTSNFIRLDTLFAPYKAIRIQDSLYFSFYYQPGGGSASYPIVQWERIGNQPESSDYLYLDFGYTQDGVTTWTNVWSTPGVSLDQWINNDPLHLTYFKQVLIPITDPVFLKDSFQFRFRNVASLEDQGIVGWSSNVDQWHIDYIRLDVNRTYQDIYPNDIAFVKGATAVLTPYQYVPWSHYHSGLLKDKFTNVMSNLSNTTRNASYKYHVVKNHTNAIYTYTCNNENIYPYYNNGFQQYSFHANPNVEFSITYDGQDSALYTITHIQKIDGYSGDINLFNDTIVFQQRFLNFFAYDDGTAEAGYSLYNTNPQPKSYVAIKFDLQHPDTLKAVDIWFNRTFNDESVVPFSIMVWAMGDNQKPGAVIDSFPAQLPQYADQFLDFVTYVLERPVPLTGSFFVGIMQDHNTQINIGFDQNSDARPYFYYKTANYWAEPILKGAPMIRPLVGKLYTSGVIDYQTEIPFKLYPNPAIQYNIYIEIDSDECDELYPPYFFIYDMMGKEIKRGEVSHSVKAISIENLASGPYIVKLVTRNGRKSVQKFIKY